MQKYVLTDNDIKAAEDEKTIKAILAAVQKGQRVEITRSRDGGLTIRTVHRKELKI